MRKMILALSLFATPALAEEPPTIILPTPLVRAAAQYLAQRPYAEVASILAALQGCVDVQAPNDKGVIVSHGECPAVTAALAPKPASVAPAERP